MAEWSNAPHSKCGWGEIPSEVRILYPPQIHKKDTLVVSFLCILSVGENLFESSRFVQKRSDWLQIAIPLLRDHFLRSLSTLRRRPESKTEPATQHQPSLGFNRWDGTKKNYKNRCNRPVEKIENVVPFPEPTWLGR